MRNGTSFGSTATVQSFVPRLYDTDLNLCREPSRLGGDRRVVKYSLVDDHLLPRMWKNTI